MKPTTPTLRQQMADWNDLSPAYQEHALAAWYGAGVEAMRCFALGA